MRKPSTDDLDRWVQGASLVSLAALAWTVLAPDDVVWAAAVGGSVIVCVTVAAVVARRPAVPSLARAIAPAGARYGPSRPPGAFREGRHPLLHTSTRSVRALWPRRGPPRARGEMPSLRCWLFGHERMESNAAHGVCLRCGRRPSTRREPPRPGSQARLLE